jgi:non-heme chloroperoxidase
VAKLTVNGAELFYKEWGEGQPVVFSHGWPLNSDAWEDQMYFLAQRGYRCIAHDRRGHGRSSQPWTGTNMDQYADDLNDLMEQTSAKDAILIGHSTGGGEVVRYLARHGTSRVSKVILISSIPPLMLKTPANPDGTPMEAFDQLRAALLADRSQFFKDFSMQFYGYNRPGAKVSEGVRDNFWHQGMMASFEAVCDCVKVFSETDLTEDLKKIDVPTLLIHGDDDQVVPINDSSKLSEKLIKDATLKIYSGAPHGLATTHKQQLNQDILAFIQGTTTPTRREEAMMPAT